MASGMPRRLKNFTRSSISFRDDPPVETMTGFLVVAIFSIRIQSLMSELAILMSSTPSSTQSSTETSSNGGGHGDAARLSDGVDQRRVFELREPGVKGALDVADVCALTKVAMNESINVAKLQLDRCLDIVETNDPREVPDDSQSALQVALVIVRQFEDEQMFKNLCAGRRLRMVHGLGGLVV
jgi:hypothetical protein